MKARRLPDGKVLNVNKTDRKRKDVCHNCSAVIKSSEPNHSETCRKDCFCASCNHRYCPALYHIHRPSCEHHQSVIAIENQDQSEQPCPDVDEGLTEAICSSLGEIHRQSISSEDETPQHDYDEESAQDDSEDDFLLNKRDFTKTKKRQVLRDQLKSMIESFEEDETKSESEMSLRSGTSKSSKSSQNEQFGFTDFADTLLDFSLRLETPNRAKILSKFGFVSTEGLDPKLQPKKRYEIIREMSRTEPDIDNIKRQFKMTNTQAKILTDEKVHNSTYGQIKLARKKEIAEFLIENSQLMPGNRSTIMKPKREVLDRVLAAVVGENSRTVWSDRLKCEMFLANKRVADYDFKFLMAQIKEKFDVDISPHQFNCVLGNLFFYVEPNIGWHRKSFLVI